MLHQRNLEILGYRVLAIPYYEWNSLSLSSLEAKCNYLSDHLFSLKNT
jgi:RAP domain